MNSNNCVIFGAGEYPSRCPLPRDPLLIAADGGREITDRLGLCPHLTVGDFDSLGYVPEGALVHPTHKDDTDTALAVQLGWERGCRRFWIYGGLGGRSDHSFANYSTLAQLARQGALGCLMGKEESVIALGKASLRFAPSFHGTLSVFAFGGKAEVKLQGLAYPYEGPLEPFYPLGVSNEFTSQAARVQVNDGVILLFVRAECEQLIRLLEEQP